MSRNHPPLYIPPEGKVKRRAIGPFPFAFGKDKKEIAGPLTGQFRSRAHAARPARPRLGFRNGDTLVKTPSLLAAQWNQN